MNNSIVLAINCIKKSRTWSSLADEPMPTFRIRTCWSWRDG